MIVRRFCFLNARADAEREAEFLLNPNWFNVSITARAANSTSS
ncbi:MAG TPA: hypothetical protein VEQ60_03315 [Longimicrobium sp.]|nr:hypothetical protein [Longimicrobium sp.]